MLFNSYEFILVFLPITLFLVLSLRRLGMVSASLTLLCGASLVFYAVWDWRFIGLLVGSICINYLLISALSARPRRWLMWIGIAVNLGLLGFFKYATFLGENFAALAGGSFETPDIVLPLAISFFTLQQISMLVDASLQPVARPRFRDYALYVSFFPQLIAGPIVRHGEMLPQIRSIASRIDLVAFAMGVTLFAMGLLKKVALADSLKPYADVVFNGAEQTAASLGFIEAWLGALAFHFQIYFDFSGYSDMAIGLALMLGFRLPLNFNAPYKATSIIDFWRRWHLTLSRFLRDYLYIPLGGRRGGLGPQSANIMLVMLIGGLWHGSSWNFVIWGGLHGVMIVANHLWRRFSGHSRGPSRATTAVSVLLTTAGVVLAWVFFRAESLDGSLAMLAGMAGLNGLGTVTLGEPSLFDLAQSVALGGSALATLDANVLLLIAIAFAMVWVLPASQEIVNYDPAARSGAALPIRYPAATAALSGVGLSLALLALARPSEFLYFQF
ncbi:MBOAT family protein [Pelagibius sp.]|uniref:MBOAT family O-acyltransferase n=1 Tax=Pelagibius sp. TaxID=1931238 RepID=UPI00262CCE6C|nr:MBOAT family protein [Pelagibius sp.]